MKKYKPIRVTSVLSWIDSNWKEFWYRQVGFDEADKISKESAEFGTRVHKIIEQGSTGQVPFEVIKTPEDACADVILRWLDENEVEPLFGDYGSSMEVEVNDETLGLIGHFDLAAKIKNIPYVIDFKTSNKIRASFPLQKAAYAKMANKQFGSMIDDGITLRSHWDKEKQKVDFEVKYYENLNKKYWPLFLMCLEIYKYFTRKEQ